METGRGPSGGWTGGHFTGVRIAAAAYTIALAAASTAGSGAPPYTWAVRTVALPVLAALLAAGVQTRAVAAAVGLGLFVVSSPATMAAFAVPVATTPPHPAAPLPLLPIFVVLAALAAPDAAPYGSWPARERVDPRGRWSFPLAAAAAAWLVIVCGWAGAVVGVVGSGAGALLSPLGIALVVCAGALGAESVRGALWAASAAAVGGGMLVAASVDGGASASVVALGGVLLLHFLAFEPQWVPPTPPGLRPDRIFYDGDCGLCHRFIRFTLAEAQGGALPFVYTPLQSPLCAQVLAETGLHSPDRDGPLPDSVVVATGDGRLLLKSAAAFYALTRLGGVWRVVGELGALLPLPLGNFAYDLVAARRHLVFAKPKDGACPLLPKPYRAAFDLGDLPPV